MSEKATPPATWTAAALRRAWIEYFNEKEHLHLPSASLIPAADPTLLFTTAGMVPFKAYFAGTEEPPRRRVATIQKALRTTDLENVGKTERHLTFFEMLGNFSFGDYFKHEAIHYAYEFSTTRLLLPPEKIYITVYEEDDEAVEIWHKEVGIPMERIGRLGKDTNWWGPAGDSGACGPCSELYLDRGPERCICDDPASCYPGNDCERYMEYWNLVFNQFNQDTAGTLHPLPQTGIDTGAGLERIAALLNSRDSVYDTDELAQIIERVSELTAELRDDGQRIAYTLKGAVPFRVLADHSRCALFAIGDGVLPANNGRGYVIRRVLRRALLFARELGVTQPILCHLVGDLVRIYQPFYPELAERQSEIERIIRSEEERFLHTLENGLQIFEESLAAMRSRGEKHFGGFEAFRLYDTYGFPLEMTRELAEREGLEVDLDTFQKYMQEQREKASLAGRFQEIALPGELPVAADYHCRFNGYETLQIDSEVVALIQGEKSVDSLQPNVEAMVILNTTPFYAEGGGQLGDEGHLIGKESLFVVKDTRRKHGLILHIGELLRGNLKRGDQLRAEVDSDRRSSMTRHHSATHLLNQALRDTLGAHILQTGSLVSPDYLRFDFSHGEKIDPETLRKVEAQVNAAIERREPVEWVDMALAEAKEAGALANFGEKYGERVRVVQMGKGGELSTELCGGCHVTNTAEVASFHILKESSPGAGNRRIEALAGKQVEEYFQSELITLSAQIQDFNESLLKVAGQAGRKADNSEVAALFYRPELPDHRAVAQLFSGKQSRAVAELSDLLRNVHQKMQQQEKLFHKFRKQLEEESTSALQDSLESLLDSAEKIGDLSILCHVFDDVPAKSLRTLGDSVKERLPGAVILFGSRTEKGPQLLFMANQQATKAGIHVGNLIRSAAAELGGSGGGRPDMAQAGGKENGALSKALAKARSEIDSILGNK